MLTFMRARNIMKTIGKSLLFPRKCLHFLDGFRFLLDAGSISAGAKKALAGGSVSPVLWGGCAVATRNHSIGGAGVCSPCLRLEVPTMSRRPSFLDFLRALVCGLPRVDFLPFASVSGKAGATEEPTAANLQGWGSF